MKCIDDYINGNLTDAKEGAARHSWRALYLCLIEDYGKTHRAAVAIADYLKGRNTFQDAVNADDDPPCLK